MQKRVKIVLAVVLVVLAGAITWQLVPEPEPVYQGKSLSDWLLNYDVRTVSLGTIEGIMRWRAQRLETDKAVKHMGTKAVPRLLQLVRKKDSALLLRFITLAQRHQHFVKINHVPAQDWNRMAADGFFALGHTADYVTPRLVEIYERNISPESHRAALAILANIGPPAKEIVPSLLVMVNDSDEQTRYGAIWALGRIHREPERTIPVLIQTLHDPVRSIRASASVGLREFGPAANQAYPALLEAVNDQNSGIRDEVVSALCSIDPEAAAKQFSGETVEVP